MRKYDLLQCRQLRIDINEMEERLFELESSAERITPVLSDMPKGSSRVTDSRAEIITAILDLEAEINYQVAQSHINSAKIENEIHIKQLTGREATVIRLRYINCLKWPQILEALGCTEQHMHRIHAAALKRLE